MNNYRSWDDVRGKIVSKKGGWRIGLGVESHGYDLVNQLVGHYSYMQVIVMNVLGKMPSREFADWLEALHICLSWPDPRIWCNRVGALGGSSGCSLVATVSSGMLAQEAVAYGNRTLIEGIGFIQKALIAVESSEMSVEDFVNSELKKYGGKPQFMGYARPIAKGDERIGALERVSESLGYKVGPHMALAYQIEQLLSERFDESMNINGYTSAFFADQGIGPEEAYRLTAVLVSSGVAACYVDAKDKEAFLGKFSPQRTSDINYTGASERTVNV